MCGCGCRGSCALRLLRMSLPAEHLAASCKWAVRQLNWVEKVLEYSERFIYEVEFPYLDAKSKVGLEANKHGHKYTIQTLLSRSLSGL